MEYVRYFVSRDYTKECEALGCVTCADFYQEKDAREYYRWKKRDWDAEEKRRRKNGNPYRQPFEWKLGKRTEIWEDDGRIRFEYEWLEG